MNHWASTELCAASRFGQAGPLLSPFLSLSLCILASFFKARCAGLKVLSFATEKSCLAATKRAQQRHSALAAHRLGDAGPGAAGKGEDQRTILPSLNLTV